MERPFGGCNPGGWVVTIFVIGDLLSGGVPCSEKRVCEAGL